jgi:uncharacterized protein involved in propanediol utilization
MPACELSRAALSAHASCHASFGELLQGALPDERHFLVTLPIELYTYARFSVPQSARDLRVEPEGSWKALCLASDLLARRGLPVRGELTLESEIPRGKGLASSTADLVATHRAVSLWHQLPDTADDLESLLRKIEPSDGLMHPGVVAYLHREARLLDLLGPVPPITLVAIDEGGEVDSVTHNRRDFKYAAHERDEYAALLARLSRAVSRGDVEEIGAVATRSAQLNQRVQPKRSLAEISSIAAEVGAAGVVAAHSGTYLGIVIDARGANHVRQSQLATARLKELRFEPKLLKSLSGRSAVQECAHA